jgi:hypothetical protein
VIFKVECSKDTGYFQTFGLSIVFNYLCHFSLPLKLSLCVFLTLALVAGEWSASCPGHFTPGEISPGIHWIGGSVGPRTGLDEVEKRKFLTLPGHEL